MTQGSEEPAVSGEEERRDGEGDRPVVGAGAAAGDGATRDGAEDGSRGDADSGDAAEAPDDDERTVRALLEGAENPIGDVERGAAGLGHQHRGGHFGDPQGDRAEEPAEGSREESEEKS